MIITVRNMVEIINNGTFTDILSPILKSLQFINSRADFVIKIRLLHS